MKIGSREAVYSAKSTDAAWTPLTFTSRSVPSVTPGMTSSRRVCTSASVSSSCGAVVGNTWNTAAVPSSFGRGGVTAATPSVWPMVSDSWLSVARSASPFGVAVASRNGPL